MNSGRWRTLRPQLGHRIPARIEKYQNRPDVMLVGDAQEYIDTLKESLLILLPEKVMQEDTHRVHAKALCPAQLAIDLLWVERFRLPHLQLVTGTCGDVVAPDQPRLLCVPTVCVISGPPLCLGQTKRTCEKNKCGEFCDTFHVS